LAFHGDYIYGTNPEKHQGQDMKNWKFKSVHPKDIDFEELGASVTRQNPMALVRGQYATEKVTIDENYVVVHKSLYDKSLVANIDTPNFMLTNFRETQAGHRVYGNVPTKDLAEWVKWAKEVKAAPWHNEDRRKVTFEVDLVSV